MASYNRVIMMGNLTRDPEHKQLASGQAVCRFGLASNRQFKNKQTGTLVQEVCFKLDSWQDNEGAKRSKHTIVADRVTFLASGAQAESAGSSEGFDAGSSDSGTPDFAASAKEQPAFVP